MPSIIESTQTLPTPGSAPAPGSTPGSTPGPSRRQRAKELVARLRDRQLRSALSGQIIESAVYAHRAGRVRQLACPCVA